MRGLSLLALVPLLLAACGSPRPEVSASRATVGVAEVSRAAYGFGVPQFPDADPHDWSGRTPWHYPVHGIDVSKWQGDIDWPTVRASGISFAYLKATEGGDVIDDRFLDNWQRAAAAGLPRGAYHFYYFCRTAAEQAAWFTSHVPRDPGALPAVLDMEWNHKSRTCPVRPAPEQIRAEMMVYLQHLTRYYGKRPMFYTTVDFYRDNQLWRVPGHNFWLRSVADHPSGTYPGQPWALWQYTGTALVPGIAGHTDLNAFAGTREQWLGFAYGG